MAPRPAADAKGVEIMSAACEHRSGPVALFSDPVKAPARQTPSDRLAMRLNNVSVISLIRRLRQVCRSRLKAFVLPDDQPAPLAASRFSLRRAEAVATMDRCDFTLGRKYLFSAQLLLPCQHSPLPPHRRQSLSYHTRRRTPPRTAQAILQRSLPFAQAPPPTVPRHLGCPLLAWPAGRSQGTDTCWLWLLWHSRTRRGQPTRPSPPQKPPSRLPGGKLTHTPLAQPALSLQQNPIIAYPPLLHGHTLSVRPAWAATPLNHLTPPLYSSHATSPCPCPPLTPRSAPTVSGKDSPYGGTFK